MNQTREKAVARATFAVGLLLFVLAGCGSKEPIRHYSAPKDPNVTSTRRIMEAENRQRLLGAIVPWQEKAWFFKMTGPLGAMDGHEQPFLEFIQSIRFENDEPTWTLPAGWEQSPGSGMRFATIRVPSESAPLEVSVIALGIGTDDLPTYILHNVNRWREQLSMKPLTVEQYAQQAVRVQLDGTMATWVNCEGSLGSDGMHGPASGGMPPRGMPPGGSD